MKPQILNDNERRDWLRLSRAENVGPVTFRHLLRRFGSAARALDALPEMAAKGGKRGFKLPEPGLIEKEITGARKSGAKIIALCEPDYPEALANIADAPPLITIYGQVSFLHKRAVGIVGARNASLNGRKMAEMLARNLGQAGITVISGLARGIDAAAHAASLATGTVAALAGGADVVYPQENRALYDRVREQGCIVSDQPLGLEPFAKLFPRRNRIISGLSLGIVVVEAALQSGSLITARMALEQGREVFAVPGSPLDPRCAGANDLLRQGAVLTEKADDILAHIHKQPKGLFEPPPAPIDAPLADAGESQMAAVRAELLEYLGPSPVAVDELVRQSGSAPAVVLTVLLELELAGRLERQPGQKVALVG